MKAIAQATTMSTKARIDNWSDFIGALHVRAEAGSHHNAWPVPNRGDRVSEHDASGAMSSIVIF